MERTYLGMRSRPMADGSTEVPAKEASERTRVLSCPRLTRNPELNTLNALGTALGPPAQHALLTNIVSPLCYKHMRFLGHVTAINSAAVELLCKR